MLDVWPQDSRDGSTVVAGSRTQLDLPTLRELMGDQPSMKISIEESARLAALVVEVRLEPRTNTLVITADSPEGEAELFARFEVLKPGSVGNRRGRRLNHPDGSSIQFRGAAGRPGGLP